MEFTWSKAKRAANLKAPGLDFVDVPRVFEGLTFTFEDDRFTCGEQRFVTLGLLAGTPVSIVHTEPNMKSASSPSAKPRSVKRKSTSGRSKTDWAKLKARPPGKPTREHPEADIQHIVRGMVRRGLQPKPSKAAVSLRVDEDVIEWFKAQGPGYQTRINSVLRAFRDASV